MPDLHSYQASEDTLSDFQSGENFVIPVDTFLQTKLRHAYEYGSQLLFRKVEAYALNNATSSESPSLGEIPNRWLPAQEAHLQYGVTLPKGERISTLAAQRMSEFLSQDQERRDIISRAKGDPGTQVLGFMAMVLGRMLDPMTLIGGLVIGLLAPSLRLAVLLGCCYGIALAALFSVLSSQAGLTYPVWDIGLAQVTASVLLSSIVYGCKVGWKKPKLQDTEPKPKVIRKPLNLAQRIVVSIAIPLMFFGVLKALLNILHEYPYFWSDTWWVWMVGLVALTWFEIWFWRDRI